MAAVKFPDSSWLTFPSSVHLERSILPSTNRNPADPLDPLDIRRTSCPLAPSTSTAWISSPVGLHWFPIVRIPTPVDCVPQTSCLLQHTADKSPTRDRVVPQTEGTQRLSNSCSSSFTGPLSTVSTLAGSRDPFDRASARTDVYDLVEPCACSFRTVVFSESEHVPPSPCMPPQSVGTPAVGSVSTGSCTLLLSQLGLTPAGNSSQCSVHLVSLCTTPTSSQPTQAFSRSSCGHFPYPHGSCVLSEEHDTSGSCCHVGADSLPSLNPGSSDYTNFRVSESHTTPLSTNHLHPMALPSDFNSRCSISDNPLDRDLVDLAPLDSVPLPQPSAECDRLDRADDAESSGVDFTHQSNQASLPFTSCEPERSTFLKSSVSDIPLTSLEELLARSSINDVYIGPVKGDDGKLLPLDPNRRTLTDPSSLPYSSSSLAFAPPGIIMVSEIWSMFVTERLSYCNHRIHGLNVNALRTCLYDHGLNQLGCPAILRRRLQEFVRRVRYAMSNGSGCLDSQDLLGPNHTESFETREPNETSVASQPISNDVVSDIPSSLCSLSSSGSAFPRSIKLTKPIILTPDTFYSYLLIIDLEATCDVQTRSKTVPEYPHEIIEFPVLLYNTRTRRCVGVFHSYCRPKLNPDLTTFCTNLTQISQVQVDTACSFPQVLTKIENWLFTQHHLSDVRCAIVCDCSADMGKFMRIQCRLDGIPLPSWAKVWINLSKAFRLFYKLPSRHPVTLSTMLHDLNLSFIGQQHRGLDDAINILRVVRTLLADGCVLRVNERVDSGRAPTFVTSVPRLVAEKTSGLMGSRLLLLSQKSRGGVEKEDTTNHTCLPVEIPEDHRQSLLWLANVQKSRLPNNY
ncbi:hypothetical protein P879_08214 [Paragonimus westermani]|uniref:Exonuclease domain-containing protein n=1 Tax=Paragonimus westermani TaxID=34504 RepID=A0A8T0DHA9_9TREM|nr:hypothetical protein P879_08214 [Paragonimus westermani]